MPFALSHCRSGVGCKEVRGDVKDMEITGYDVMGCGLDLTAYLSPRPIDKILIANRHLGVRMSYIFLQLMTIGRPEKF